MSVAKFDKRRFNSKVEARSRRLTSKAEIEFEELVKQLVEEFGIYKKSRSKTLELAIQIHKTGLWQGTHTNFADFLMDKLSIKKSYAYNLIEAAKIAEENPDKPVANERQARAVANSQKNGEHSPEKPKENEESEPRNTTDKNSTSGGNGNSVKSGSKQESKTEEVQLDDVDTPIPKDALPYWNQLKEVQAVITALGKLKSIVVNGQNDKKTNWPKCANYIADTFDQLRVEISEAKPYTVCTTCMGSPSMQPGQWCGFCKGTGMISKRLWDTCSMQEIKDIRIKSNAEFAKQNGPH